MSSDACPYIEAASKVLRRIYQQIIDVDRRYCAYNNDPEDDMFSDEEYQA